jgi:indole-3-glycerol phosphate synthase
MILDTIISSKKEEVAADLQTVALADMKRRCLGLPQTRGFKSQLAKAALSRVAIIAEVKKGSPSKGIIREDFHPVSIAKEYEKGGAACLSVLTDQKFFFGHLDYLEAIRAEVALPLLRKDFVVDPYQIYQARAAGADAILLIAAVLNRSQLIDYAELAAELDLDVLLEVHDEDELDIALQVPDVLLGINNRNLKTFETDLGITERLCKLIPSERAVVAESGINTRIDIDRLLNGGAAAFLIGESLMRETDISQKLSELIN